MVLPNQGYENELLNREFTDGEIQKCIKKLKTRKSAGVDHILNEYLMASGDVMLPVFTKLFNLILKTGMFPSSWTAGIIIPIYKNKGEKDDPDNYRGITLLSCFSKLFTSALNHRITEYIESHSLMGEEQAGFRSGYGTMDHIFTLKCIIDIYLNKKKKLYAAFIDYRKAFDSVWRIGLWQKLLKYNINGRVFKVITSLYGQVKSCVKTKEVKTNKGGNL